MSTDLPERDAEGYLIEPGDWNEEVARALAQEENIQLTDDHWDTIRFMRDYYEEHQVIADARFVIKHLAERVGKDAPTSSAATSASGCRLPWSPPNPGPATLASAAKAPAAARSPPRWSTPRSA
ncbi:MAG: TusE/DsrC/DsvC family sulfur relay protein [Candidatus Thermoplasmatota archaeon]|nr:TusE/DsrC/DsvC family sulfur relay protein [Candidatus Thermoplasmatota archaeon]